MAHPIRMMGAVLFLLFASACAIKPDVTPSAMMCNFTKYELEVDVPPTDEGELEGVEVPFPGTSLRDVVAEAFRQPADPAQRRTVPDSMLYLSGGSLHGAFGAGFLDEWRQMRPNGLPRFRVVTGISTGSILSTFAFIGETAPPAGPTGYAILSESQLLTPIIRRRNGRLENASLIDVATRGAVADLSPLRTRLLEEIDRGVLQQVQAAYHDGRRLFVGVVDVDSGKAVALDMTEMADRYVRTGDERYRGCYAEAIVASSSTPLAALPAFIDNRMYIDGGARFGMFSEELHSLLAGEPGVDRRTVDTAQIYVIVNGNLETEPDCGKADASLCQPPNPPSGGADGAHKDWNLLALAFRSQSILVNQIYRLSFDRIRLQSHANDDQFRAVRMEPDSDTHSYTMDVPALGTGTRTCAEWKAMDRDLDHPIQFYPRYMHCLIDYGRARAREANWAALPG